MMAAAAANQNFPSDDEYRKIPGSHVLTEEERSLVTERSRIRIRENKDKRIN